MGLPRKILDTILKVDKRTSGLVKKKIYDDA